MTTWCGPSGVGPGAVLRFGRGRLVRLAGSQDNKVAPEEEGNQLLLKTGRTSERGNGTDRIVDNGVTKGMRQNLAGKSTQR